MPRSTLAVLAILTLLAPAALARAHARPQPRERNGTPPNGDPQRIFLDSAEPIRVFLDCDRCDFNYLRQNIHYVSYVRDRKDAQVHVLVNTRGSGSGREWTVSFIGLEEFSGIGQQVIFSTSSTDTDDEQRREFARVFQLGLVRYVLETPMADDLDIVYRPRAAEEPSTPAEDPWDLWVFRTGIGSFTSGEELKDETSVDGFFNASRTTDMWKMSFGVSGNYKEQNFEFEDGSTYRSTVKNSNLGGRVIRSFGEHWGWGFGASARKSTYLNLDLSSRLAGAVEYNLYPYSLSAKKALTVSYFLGGMDLDYREATVLGKTSEVRVDHGFITEFDAERPWGESGVDLELRSFADDFSQYRVVLRGRLEYRLFRGFSVNLSGNVSLVRDQIYLPAEEQTIEDILVNNRALQTDATYQLRLGFNYTFGSIYNNIVNSRLSARSGGFNRIF